MQQGSRQPKVEETESAEIDEAGAVDAAQAFDALQAEVALQRRAIEALGEALDGVLQGRTPPDLSPDIGRILQGQAQVAQNVEQLRQHPALKLTPVQYGEALAQAGSAVVREAAQQLGYATQAVERERAQLRELMGTAKAHGQRRRLWCIANLALAAGLLLSPLLVRSLPVSLSSHVAAFMLAEDRWRAGWALMRTANPEKTPQITNAVNLVQANEKSLAGCKENAAKTKRDQRCLITVPAS